MTPRPASPRPANQTRIWGEGKGGQVRSAPFSRLPSFATKVPLKWTVFVLTNFLLTITSQFWKIGLDGLITFKKTTTGKCYKIHLFQRLQFSRPAITGNVSNSTQWPRFRRCLELIIINYLYILLQGFIRNRNTRNRFAKTKVQTLWLTYKLETS